VQKIDEISISDIGCKIVLEGLQGLFWVQAFID
jgi:hypothetical protein